MPTFFPKSFIVGDLVFKCEARVQPTSCFACRYPAVLEPFVENILSYTEWSGTLVKNQLPTNLRVYF